ncbi:MAG TPA: DUF5666 domain-containing protein [Alphaproteobacteria bacterium]|jgi:hypothetical protein|nr:DUF5666 domain-containing protein [Alphaproteobacteria bacterium]
MRIAVFPIAAFAVTVLLGAFPLTAAAQDAGVNLRGTIDKVEGDKLVLNTREGTKATVALSGDTRVSGTEKRTLADIKDGSYVASTSMKGTDGKLHAMEVHLFPPGPPPRNLNQRPYDLAPNSLMTNAQVKQISKVGANGEITVNYEGKNEVVVVTPDTPIVIAVAGDKSLLKPGATVFIAATKKADGTYTATRITAEKNGVKPPM